MNNPILKTWRKVKSFGHTSFGLPFDFLKPKKKKPNGQPKLV
jgi:hypothetical protein